MFSKTKVSNFSKTKFSIVALLSSICLAGLLSVTLLMGLSGCSNFPPRIYRIDVMQGNDIKPEMIKQLRVGMSKEQVQEILGSPTLVHSLDKDRWDYYFSMVPGRKGPKVEKHFTVFFRQGKLVNWTTSPV